MPTEDPIKPIFPPPDHAEAVATIRSLMTQALRAPGRLVLPPEPFYLGWPFDAPVSPPPRPMGCHSFNASDMRYGYYELAQKLRSYGPLPVAPNSKPGFVSILGCADQFNAIVHTPDEYPLPAAELAAFKERKSYFAPIFRDAIHVDYGTGHPFKLEGVYDILASVDALPARTYGVDLANEIAAERRAAVFACYRRYAAGLTQPPARPPRYADIKFDMFDPPFDDCFDRHPPDMQAIISRIPRHPPDGAAGLPVKGQQRFVELLKLLRKTSAPMVTTMLGGTLGNHPAAERLRHLRFSHLHHKPGTRSIFGVHNTSHDETLMKIYGSGKFRQLFLTTFVQCCWSLGIDLDMDSLGCRIALRPAKDGSMEVFPIIDVSRDYDIPALPGTILAAKSYHFMPLAEPSVDSYINQIRAANMSVQATIRCPNRNFPKMEYTLLVVRNG